MVSDLCCLYVLVIVNGNDTIWVVKNGILLIFEIKCENIFLYICHYILNMLKSLKWLLLPPGYFFYFFLWIYVNYSWMLTVYKCERKRYIYLKKMIPRYDKHAVYVMKNWKRYSTKCGLCCVDKHVIIHYDIQYMGSISFCNIKAKTRIFCFWIFNCDVKFIGIWNLKLYFCKIFMKHERLKKIQGWPSLFMSMFGKHLGT